MRERLSARTIIHNTCTQKGQKKSIKITIQTAIINHSHNSFSSVQMIVDVIGPIYSDQERAKKKQNTIYTHSFGHTIELNLNFCVVSTNTRRGNRKKKSACKFFFLLRLLLQTRPIHTASVFFFYEHMHFQWHLNSCNIFLFIRLQNGLFF